MSKTLIFILGLILISQNAWSDDSSAGSQDAIKEIVAGQETSGDDVDTNSISTVPSGTFDKPISPSCNPKTLEETLIGHNLNTQQVADGLKKYFARCGEYLSTGKSKGLLGLAKFALVKYEVFENPDVKPVVIKFSNDTQTLGFIALKPGQVKRPFVVVKCGLMCDGNPSTSTRNYLIHLFDESPFNVLFLANHTGAQQIMSNQSLTFGGYDESAELIEVAQWLKERSPFKNIISSLHLVGISLGGQAALYSSLMNDNYQEKTGKQAYSSVMAICPVVQLHETMDYIFTEGSALGTVMKKMTWNELTQVYNSIPEGHDLIDLNKPPRGSEIPVIMSTIASRYMKIRNEKLGMPFFMPGSVDNLEDFWYYNNFFNMLKPAQTPTLVWASKDDIVVKNDINAGLLEKAASFLSDSPSFNVLNLPYGSHCGFSTVYGFPTITSTIKSFILSHDSEFIGRARKTQLPLDFSNFKINKWEKYVSYAWEAEQNKNYVNLTVKVFNSYKDTCFKEDAFTAEKKCYRSISNKISLKDLAALNINIPATETPAQVLTRYLNANVQVMNAQGRIEGSSDKPSFIQWMDYQ